MVRVLIGVLIGLVLGWMTVPFVRANYSVDQSDKAAVSGQTTSHYQPMDLVDDEPNIRSYKGYLHQMLLEIHEVNVHLKNIETNTFAVKEKLKA